MKSKQPKYNRRVWLNSTSSPSTGSVVCYYNPEKWDSFVEVSSCSSVARLHAIGGESVVVFYNKVKLLRDELNRYLSFLETEVLNK